MTADNTISVGDICTYSYDNDNKSLSIVEVVKEFSDEVLVVKFLQVIVDDSGNGLFTYLCKTGKTMNVSKKYLHKILLINRQQAEIERLSDRNHKCIYLSDDETIEYCVDGPCSKFKTESQIKAEAIKEFWSRLQGIAYRSEVEWSHGEHPMFIELDDAEEIYEEMVGDTE